MKTDVSLKYAFDRLRHDLKHLTGDSRARVLDAAPRELVEIKRRPDLIWRLERGGGTYYRHMEFNGRGRRDILQRAALYNHLATVRLECPVLTTIIQVRPPRLAPPGGKSVTLKADDEQADRASPLLAGGERVRVSDAQATYEMHVGRRVIHRWSFDVVNLFELPAERALRSRRPGLLALLPLMKGGTQRRAHQALRVLQHLEPSTAVADARLLLLNLAQERYPDSGLNDLVTKEQLMQSVLFREIRREAEKVGEARGVLRAQRAMRELCLEMIKQHHPGLLEVATPAIKACKDTGQLKEWTLLAPRAANRRRLKRALEAAGARHRSS